MKKLFLKTLMTALVLLTGGVSSAWADDIVSLPSNNDFSKETSTVSPFDNGEIATGINVKGLRFYNSGSVTATAYFDTDSETEGKQPYTLASNEKVTIQLEGYHGYISGKSATLTIYNSLNEALVSYTYSHSDGTISALTFGGVSPTGFAAFDGKSYIKKGSKAQSWSTSNRTPFVATDGYNPTITITISGSGSATFNLTTSVQEINQSYNSSILGKTLDLAKIEVKDGTSNQDRAYGIKYLNITTETTSEVKYTVKRMCGTEVLSTEEYYANPGTTPTIEETAFWKDGVKYLYSSNDVSEIGGIESDGSTIYTVDYSAAALFNYAIQAVYGPEESKVKIADISSGVAYDGDMVSTAYQNKYNVDGTIYAKAPNSQNYHQSFTITKDNQVCDLVYEATSETGVVYFSEAEAIEGATPANSGGNMTNRSSNAFCAYARDDIVLTNLPAGVYKATMVFYANSSAGITLPFDFGGTEYNATESAANNWATATTDFTLYLASDIIWKKSGDSKNGLDFVYIQKIRDVSEAEIALANAKKKLGLAIEQAEGLYNAEKTGAEDLNTAMAGASELLYGEQADEATIEDLTAALVSLTQAIGTYVYANMSDEMKQAVTLVADNDALTAANVANIVATAETTDSDELAALIIEAVTNDANGVEDLAAAIAEAITTGDESGLADAIAAFEAANAPFDPNSLIVNGDFEGTYESAYTINTDRYVYQPEGWTVDYVNVSTWNMTVVGSTDAMASNFTDSYAVAEGNNKYMVRFRDNQTSEYVDLSQTITVPYSGTYTFSADMIREDGSKINVLLYVGENSVSNANPNVWENRSVTVELEANTEIKVGVRFANLGATGTKAGIDNIQVSFKSAEEIAAEELATAKETLDAEIVKAKDFKIETRTEGLTDYESAIADAESAMESTSLEDVTQAIANLQTAELSFLTANLPVQEGTYYIYNPLTKMFLGRGNEWGTSAVVGNYGVAINVTPEVSTEIPDGKYTLTSFDNNTTYGDDTWMYADAGGNRARTYTIAKSGVGYTMTNTNNNKLVYVYLKEDVNKYRVAGNAIKDDNYTDDAQTVWQFITPDAYNTMIANRIAAEKTAAFTFAEIAEDDEVVSGESVELTFATGHGWTQTVVREQDGQPKTNENGTEMWQATGYYTQTVTGLESGLYKVSIQAFYRSGGVNDCVTHYNTGYNTVLAYLDANGSKVQVKSWAEDNEDNDPDNMSQAKAKFDDGKYVSETYAYVGDDGKLNLTVYNPAFISGGWFIVGNVTYTPQYPLTAIATTDDYDALNEAIEAAPTLGFLAGEAAPYNNVNEVKILAAAKAIDPTVMNLATTVQEMTATLNAAKWVTNTEEVNAIYDGDFNIQTVPSDNTRPLGWARHSATANSNDGTDSGYETRLVSLVSGVTKTDKGMMTKHHAFYGDQIGYQLPLKADTYYTLSFKYCGWNEKPEMHINVYGEDGTKVANSEDFSAKDNQGHIKADSWQEFSYTFKTGDAGNYVIGIMKNVGGTTQSQGGFTDMLLLKTPETPVTMTVADAHYATFCAPFDVEIPVGVTAYTVDGVNESTKEIEWTALSGSIPANTPVLLYSETVVDGLEFSGIAVEGTPENGLLVGVYEATPAIADTYVLQKQGENVAFYKVATEGVTTIAPNHAYMTIPGGDGARAYYLNGEATAIGALKALTSGDAEIFDVNGRKQVNLQKGVNIIRTKDGRTQKIMVK